MITTVGRFVGGCRRIVGVNQRGNRKANEAADEAEGRSEWPAMEGRNFFLRWGESPLLTYFRRSLR